MECHWFDDEVVSSNRVAGWIFFCLQVSKLQHETWCFFLVLSILEENKKEVEYEFPDLQIAGMELRVFWSSNTKADDDAIIQKRFMKVELKSCLCHWDVLK